MGSWYGMLVRVWVSSERVVSGACCRVKCFLYVMRKAGHMETNLLYDL